RSSHPWLRLWPRRRRHAAHLLRQRRRHARARPGQAAPRPGVHLAMSLVSLQTVDAGALRRELEAVIEGEVRFDNISRALYSTDASVYQIQPLGVVVAKNRQDILS